MRQDTFYLRDHGTLAHLLTMTAIARELRRSGWKVQTTYQIPSMANLTGPAPEVDVYAHRVEKKVDGPRRSPEAVCIGIEVEDKYSRQTILDKWTKYSIMVDRLYFVYLTPPTPKTKPPLSNTKILRLDPGILRMIIALASELRVIISEELF